MTDIAQLQSDVAINARKVAEVEAINATLITGFNALRAEVANLKAGGTVDQATIDSMAATIEATDAELDKIAANTQAAVDQTPV